MLLDMETAKILASIIFVSTQGTESLTRQLPLQIVDRGESWLVKGTPYTDESIGSKNIAQYIFIKKSSSEVIGIGSDARIILNDDERKEWSKTFNAPDYDRVFGPRTRFEPGGASSAINALMNNALYGGLVNTQEDAVAYAHALMRTTPRLSQIPVSALHAAEKSHVWHVTTAWPGQTVPTEILSFSRETGKLLSGDL